MTYCSVHYRQVIEDALALGEHSLNAVLNDDRQLVGVGRIVGEHIRDRIGIQLRVAVLMLQAFAVEGGAARRAADQKAFGADVSGQPKLVAHALQAEHRVINIHRDHRHGVRGVGGAGGDKARHRTGLVDALFQNLTVLGLLIIHHVLTVNRLIQLPARRVNAEATDQAFHAEGARLVGHNRHDVLAQRFVAQQIPASAKP